MHLVVRILHVADDLGDLAGLNVPEDWRIAISRTA